MRAPAVFGLFLLLGCSSLLGLSDDSSDPSEATASSSSGVGSETSSGGSSSGESIEAGAGSSSGRSSSGSSSSSGLLEDCPEGFAREQGACEDVREWQHASQKRASNPDPNDRFGETLAVSADGTTMVVGAIGESSPATRIDGPSHNDSQGEGAGSGAAYVFAKEGGAWIQQAYVKPSDSASGARFGSAVALSADGNTMLVSASRTEVVVNGNVVTAARARAFVFARSGSAWRELQILRGNASEKDSFGRALAVSGDGSVLAVGASGAGGMVYVYQRAADGFEPRSQVTLARSNTLGAAVALSHDGATLLVGDPSDDSAGRGVGAAPGDDGVLASGAVTLFSWDGAAYLPTTFIKASNAASGARFGQTVAVSADANRFVVGAHRESSQTFDGGTLTDSGAAYVFSREGTSWRESFLKAPNARSDAAFGTSVAIAANGSTVLIGAPGESSNARLVDGDMTDSRAPKRGAAYVYSPDGGGIWGHRAYLKPSVEYDNLDFGCSVALIGTGSEALVGARDLGYVLPYGSVNTYLGAQP